MSEARPESPLAHAQAALDRGDWRVAHAGFEHALATAETAEAWEGLSWAALGLDDGEQAIHARQAAYRLYRHAGDDVSAARMAMWAGKDHEEFRGELAVARGWRQRAHRLLQAQPTVPEHGWLALLDCWAALQLGEDPEQARRCAGDAINVAEQCNEPDIGIVALAVDGLALVGAGKVDDGMKRLDEAATAVLGGELRHEIWSLVVFCLLIYACERVRDLGRAAQWCEMMREAADRIRHTASQGICRTHYAAVLTFGGRWDEAEATLAEAAARFEASWPPQVAETHVRLAELRRRQGRAEEAAADLRRFEWHPLAMLGLAELALDAGRIEDAEALVERFLRHVPVTNRLARAPGLELLVRIDADTGHRQRAAATLAQLEAVADAVGTDPLRATTGFAEALVAARAGEAERARAGFEDAVMLFDRCGLPFEAARARLELAELLVSLDRLERAREEALAARQVLADLGAGLLLPRGDALVERIDRRMAGHATAAADTPLTPRQTEVLRLVAQGLSNREIAAALGISDHTVHRHVGNILLRLDAPTRAAAASRAASRGLI